MKKTYHDEIINTFIKYSHSFSTRLDFSIDTIMTNIEIPNGEIDIILEGTRGERAFIEVKENAKNMHKFLSKQLHTYQNYDTTAHIYLLLGTQNKSLDHNDFFLKKYI